MPGMYLKIAITEILRIFSAGPFQAYQEKLGRKGSWYDVSKCLVCPLALVISMVNILSE